MAERERRTIAYPVEIRAGADRPNLSGYAAVFGEITEIAGLFKEQIAPGAFAEAVTRDDVRSLFNHDSNYVLGRTTAGTLRLVEDDKGLRYDVDPPDTTWARDLMVSVQRGDVSQSSFAFEVTEESWDYGQKGDMPIRTISNVRLYDVSPVTYPAYASTSVSARSLEAAKAPPAPDESWRVSVEMSRERCRLTDVLSR
jgi:HK97 family phage prohead protease